MRLVCCQFGGLLVVRLSYIWGDKGTRVTYDFVYPVDKAIWCSEMLDPFRIPEERWKQTRGRKKRNNLLFPTKQMSTLVRLVQLTDPKLVGSVSR